MRVYTDEELEEQRRKKEEMGEEDDTECEHEEHDHGICLDCGKDITDELVTKAEMAFEDDR